MKSKFTWNDHLKTGAELLELRQRLMVVAAKVLAAYPKTSPAAKKAAGVVNALDALRCALDGLACDEHRDREDAVRLYCPGSQGQPSATQLNRKDSPNELV